MNSIKHWMKRGWNVKLGFGRLHLRHFRAVFRLEMHIEICAEMNNINNMHTSRECESWIVAASASDRWICSNYFYWKWSCSITRGCFLTNISMLVRSWQDMLLSLQRPIRVLGEVTTVNMSFHASYQSKDGQSMLLGGFGIGFFRVLFWLFQLLNGQEWQIWDDDPDGPSYLAFIYITYIYIHSIYIYIYTIYIYTTGYLVGPTTNQISPPDRGWEGWRISPWPTTPSRDIAAGPIRCSHLWPSSISAT